MLVLEKYTYKRDQSKLVEKLQAFKHSISTNNCWLQNVCPARPSLSPCALSAAWLCQLVTPDRATDFGSPVGITCATPISGSNHILDPVSTTRTVLWNAVHVFSVLPPLLCSWLNFAPSSQCQYLAQVHFAMLPIQELFSKPKQIRRYKLVKEPDITGTLIAVRNYG